MRENSLLHRLPYWPLLVLIAGATVIYACAEPLPDREIQNQIGAQGGMGGSSNQSTAGSPASPRGGSGATIIGTGGSAGRGGAGVGGGTGGTGSGGMPPTNECLESADCTPIDGQCVACEVNLATQLFQCVNRGPSVCDGALRDPCELCDGADLGTATCATVTPPAGAAGPFNFGTLACDDTCQGYDTSSCSICGNDTVEATEECDGADLPVMNCAALGLMPPAAGADDPLACDNARCAFDTTPCPKCTADIADADCLRDGATACANAGCNGKQCGTTETCDVDCSGFQQVCTDLSCNDGATCNLACGGEGDCTIACLAGSTCIADCNQFAGICTATCDAGAVCDFACAQSGSCDLTCAAGSACSLDCSLFGSACSGTAVCSAGETCTYECGQMADCSGLAVTCEADATCNFDCNAAESGCPAATCAAGSTCNFTCGGGQNSTCNAPSCEDLNDCICLVAGVDCGFTQG